MICLHATHMDDAITRQPHVELCSQHGTSRIMQLSKWTEQRKNKSQNHKKKCTTPTCCSILYIFVLQLETKKTHRIIFLLHTHTREKRPTTNPQPAPQRIRQKSSGQSGFFAFREGGHHETRRWETIHGEKDEKNSLQMVVVI